MGRYTQQGALNSIYITAKDGSAYHFMQGSDLYPAINKLAHYEDLEEQGRLIELPCGVGQEAYAVIRAMDMTETGHLIPKPVIRTITPVSLQDCWRMRQDVGMSVFLTKEEARQALKGGVKE